MNRRSRQPAVPPALAAQTDTAVATVRTALADLDRATQHGAPLLERRAAHRELEAAFDAADALLRRATTLARQSSYREWSQWRHRLSQLGTARNLHRFAEQDDMGVLRVGSVRAIDTGMSGPDYGDLLHGESRAPGTPPTYGLDLDAVLTAAPTAVTAPLDQGPRRDAVVLPLPTTPAGRAPEAA